MSLRPYNKGWKEAECKDCFYQVEGYCRRNPPQVYAEDDMGTAKDETAYPCVVMTFHYTEESEQMSMEACSEFKPVSNDS